MIVYEGNRFRGGFEKNEIRNIKSINKKLDTSQKETREAMENLGMEQRMIQTWLDFLSKVPQFVVLNPSMLARAVFFIQNLEENEKTNFEQTVTQEKFQEIAQKVFEDGKHEKEEYVTLFRYVRFLIKERFSRNVR
jgi:hypothetical protein